MARILVIDDDPMLNKGLCYLFNSAGHTTKSALSGGSGLVALAAFKPDLVILDQRMPDIDGLDLLHILRDSPEAASLPVVMYTGYPDSKFYGRAKRMGANDAWFKCNLKPDELLSQVHQLTRAIEKQ